jgi:hypothetical protein
MAHPGPPSLRHWVEAEPEDEEIGEEEDERDAGEKKIYEKNVRWGKREKKVIFLKKLKVKNII